MHFGLSGNLGRGAFKIFIILSFYSSTSVAKRGIVLPCYRGPNPSPISPKWRLGLHIASSRKTQGEGGQCGACCGNDNPVKVANQDLLPKTLYYK